MFNREETLQNCIITAVDFEKLMRLNKEETLFDLHQNGFVYYTLTKKELIKLYGNLPIFNRTRVSEARLHIGFDKAGIGQEGLFYLKFVTGEHAIVPIDITKINLLYDLFQKEGQYYPLNKRIAKVAAPWDTHELSEHYTQSTHAFYDVLHDQIKKALLKLIKSQDIRSLNIIDGGCGTGRFLKKMAIELPLKLSEETKNEDPARIHLFGFDINSNNIRDCRTLFTSGTGVKARFELANLTETDKAIAHFAESNPQIPYGNLRLAKEAKTVLVLSGSLTRMVLKNTFEAVKALQTVLLSEEIDFIIGGGLGEPLINHYIAKKIGLKLVPLDPERQHKISSEGEFTKFFAFERMSLEEQLQHKIKKMTKRNVLDLRLLAKPELVLEALLQKIRKGELIVEKDLVINLSFARIDEEVLFPKLKAFMEQCPKATLLFQHYDQTCIDTFLQNTVLASKFLRPPKLIEKDMDITSSKDTLTSYSSVEMAKLLLARGEDPRDLLLKAARAGNEEVIKYFIAWDRNNVASQKIDWNQQDSKGNTLMHLAAIAGTDPAIFEKITTIVWSMRNKSGQNVQDAYLPNAKFIAAFEELRLQLRTRTGEQMPLAPELGFNEKDPKSISLEAYAYVLLMKGWGRWIWNSSAEEIKRLETELQSLIKQGINIIEVAALSRDEEVIHIATAISKRLVLAEPLTDAVSQSGHFAKRSEPAKKDTKSNAPGMQGSSG